MTKEEFDNVIASGGSVYAKSATEWDQWSKCFEEYDMVLATIAKRIAGEYRQYAARIRAHQMNALVEKNNTEFDDLEKMEKHLQEIVKKAGSK
jgi:UDP-N-acetylenolpyruvoylglucosamine reductase